MKSTTNYTDAPTDMEQSLEDATIVGDSLPSPTELVRKSEKGKITIAIDKRSLDRFKRLPKHTTQSTKP
jgi:hypothetical protein